MAIGVAGFGAVARDGKEAEGADGFDGNGQQQRKAGGDKPGIEAGERGDGAGLGIGSLACSAGPCTPDDALDLIDAGVDRGGLAAEGELALQELEVLANGTFVKLTWSTGVFDTNNNFASDRFTPTAAGKYIITLAVNCADSGGNWCVPSIYKNGSEYVRNQNVAVNGLSNSVTAILDMNGSTDYVEAYVYNAANTVTGASNFTYFNGSMLAPLASGVVAGTGSAGYVPYWTSGNAITYDSTSGGQFYWDSTNHRLGIGLTSPTYDLDVYKSTSGYVVGRVGHSDSGAGSYAMIEANAYGNSWGFRVGSSAANSNRLDIVEDANSARTPRMSIAVGGSVGIGSASPNGIVDIVKANGSYWGQTSANTWGGSTTPPQALTITNSQSGGYDPILLYRQATSTDVVKTAGAIGMIGRSSWTNGTNNTQISDLYFVTRDNADTLQERMRIDYAGNVGIGTTSPAVKLGGWAIGYQRPQPGPLFRGPGWQYQLRGEDAR